MSASGTSRTNRRIADQKRPRGVRGRSSAPTCSRKKAIGRRATVAVAASRLATFICRQREMAISGVRLLIAPDLIELVCFFTVSFPFPDVCHILTGTDPRLTGITQYRSARSYIVLMKRGAACRCHATYRIIAGNGGLGPERVGSHTDAKQESPWTPHIVQTCTSGYLDSTTQVYLVERAKNLIYRAREITHEGIHRFSTCG